MVTLSPTATRARTISKLYSKPRAISYDEIFRLCSRDVFGKERLEKLQTVVDQLHGNAALEMIAGGAIMQWENNG
jgi:hypothetical protein